ncbi:tRNA (adenine(58)-N(1))-methyltransferase TrmI [Colletotrichum sp. SAR 10_86]|nr:tRNA (adenine(58)-N(1))-methyltransferase TrmI [Colletotrichum sp. SAR 10_65]KAI8182339.1 tRNA (adenine(58)-N(1))-methyltransferase TrmI [Colletotrichum sp. SAR 10_75]KAI8226023.1 tRNA (adenine(58)-N(1))-methyltransferase TrmI [Colletotrichum sp. SAR 10_86]KAJ5005070.1 tRNA (adenine(58)-N(1))-methyltransferase TrmI [Colletotrichum sp. SAR 10_66]
MAKLETLPNELLFIILKDVRDIRGLASLAQMNRRLNEIATPSLYMAAARKKRHQALIHSAKMGNIAALEVLRACGQNLRATVNNKKELTKAWVQKQALISKQDKSLERLKKDIQKLERARSMLNYKKYPEIKPPGWKDEADEEIQKKRLEIMEIDKRIDDFKHIVVDPRQDAKRIVHFQEYGALHWAAFFGQSETVRWLLSNGVNPRQACFIQCTLLYSNGNKYLRTYTNALHLAFDLGRWSVVQVFSANKAGHAIMYDTSLWEEAIQEDQAKPAMKFAVSVASSCFHDEAGLPKQKPSEKSIIDSVNLLLDPLDCLEAHCDAEPEDIILWNERKQRLLEKQEGQVFKRAERKAQRKKSLWDHLQDIADHEAQKAAKQHRTVNLAQDFRDLVFDIPIPNFHNATQTLAIESSKTPQSAIVPRGDREAKFHLSPPLRRDGKIKLSYGARLDGSDVIGKTFTDAVKDTTGRDVRLQQVTLAQYVSNSQRVATPIYPQDASVIVSVLDLNLPSPGEDPDFDDGPPVEIFEAGTGMGALTLHLARAIHGANPPVPLKLREALCTAEYERNTLPRKPATDDDAPEYAHSPHALQIADPELAEMHAKHAASRRAILHTLDINPTSSRMAHKLVRYFRRGLYLSDVDFHVSTIRSYLSSRLAEKGGEPFLAHVILDLPASQEHADVAVQALQPGGKMVVFYPSITQILEFEMWAKDTGQPLVLDRVVELHTSTSNSDSGFKDALGGRNWEVKAVGIRKFERAGDTGPASRGYVCRPKVGTLVVGGGFLAVFSRITKKSSVEEVVEEVEQTESEEAETTEEQSEEEPSRPQ